jgi:hypothetical protein
LRGGWQNQLSVYLSVGVLAEQPQQLDRHLKIDPCERLRQIAAADFGNALQAVIQRAAVDMQRFGGLHAVAAFVQVGFQCVEQISLMLRQQTTQVRLTDEVPFEEDLLPPLPHDLPPHDHDLHQQQAQQQQ